MTTIKPTPPIVSGAKPGLGHMLEFQKDRGKLLRRGYDEQGPLFTIKLGPQNIAVVIGAEYQKTFFMETDKSLNIATPYKFLRAVFGEVFFIAPHETYLKQRPIFLQAFRRSRMLHYIDVMQIEVQRWLDSLDDEGEMEVTGEINRLVQNVAGHALMGESFQEQVGREFWDLYAVLGKAIDPVLPPDWPLPKFIRRDRATAKMKEILRPIIAERRQNPDKYNDFFQDFIESRYEDGSKIEDDVLLSWVLGFMFAGHETTAGQSAWTIILLLQNPDYLKLVQKEIQERQPVSSKIDPSVMSQLKHVAWAVRETERMRPSADILLRDVDEPLEIGGYSIPTGWKVQVAAEVAHFLPELWTEPGKFDPLRYAPGREEDKQHRFSLIGFGGGLHKCAGMNFANNEMLIITALLFQQFDLQLMTQDPGIERHVGANRPTRTEIHYRRKRSDEATVAGTITEAKAAE